MTDAALRRTKERLFTPIARALPRGVHPLMVTVIGLAPGLGAAFAAADGRYGLALALWLANRVLDGLDGTLARVQHRQSDFGGYADIHADFVIYSAIPLGIAMDVDTTRHWAATSVLLATFYLNTVSWAYLSALLERRNRGASDAMTSITMPAGLVEGTETIVLYCALLALPGHATTIVWVMSAAVLFTVAQRLVWASRTL